MSSKEWRVENLGNLVEINARSISGNFPFDEIEYIDTSTVTNNRFESLQKLKLSEAPSRAKRIVRDGDTIISTVRPIQRHFGFIQNSLPNTIASTGFAVLTPKKIHSEFLYYYLSQDSITNYLNGIAETTTTTFPAFRPDILEDLKLEIPDDIQVQCRIAGILSALDNKIELNRQTNSTLEAVARAIFKEWFVDFNFPGATGEVVESKLGMIPKGWKVLPLDEVANFLNGLALQKYPPENDQNHLPVIKIRELKNGVTDSSDRASRKLPDRYVIQDGDLIFSWSGTLEVKFWVGGEGALNQHLFKVTSEKYPLWFCYFWIIRHLDEFRGIAEDKTTTMGHIQRGHLSDALCLVPDTLQQMDKVIYPIIEKTINNEKEMISLTKIRNNLLPKLMSGEIEV